LFSRADRLILLPRRTLDHRKGQVVPLKDRSAFTNQQRIYNCIAEAGLDAVLAIQAENVIHCSGFYNFDLRMLGDRMCVVVWPREGEPVFIVPEKRAQIDAGMSFIRDIRGYRLLDGVFNPNSMRMVAEVLTEKGLFNGRIGYEALYLPAYHQRELERHLPDVRLESCDYLFDEIRMVKTEAEIEQIRFAAVQTEKAIANAYELARPGDTEKSIVNAMGYAVTKLGADQVAFNVFASGARTLLWHHLAEDVPVRNGDIIRVDYGACFDGYFSDLVRMAVVGRPSARQDRVYRGLAEGQREVIELLRVGQSMREIAAMMQEVQRRHLPDGVEVHGFGHCIGLGVHDRPFMTPADERLTQPNMTMMVEHIATDGQEQYHVEDLIVFRDEKAELLSTYTDTSAMYVIE
jgi:Xaa-Pro aminopeptidase